PLDIDATLGLDLRNASLFKKAVFPRIPAGRYVIRIRGGLDGQRYIGSQPITITENTSTRIFCRLEGTLSVALQDQDNEGIPGVDIRLLTDNVAIALNATDSHGAATLHAPMPGSYHLQATYKGFILHEQEIRLPHLNTIEVTVELHDLDVTITDRLGMPPGVTLQPVLTSSEMTTPILLTGTDRGGGRYHYEDLPSGPYTLRLRYKSYTLERDITIPASTVDVTFPAVYTLDVATRNARGMPQDYTIEITRDGRVIETDELPPGQYHVTAHDDNDVVAERDVFITGDTSIQMVSGQQPLFPLFGSIAIILAAAGIMSLLQRSGQLTLQRVLLITAAALLLLAPLQSWWQLDGSQGALDVTTQVYLLPAEMVTTGTAPGYTGGDIADLPGLFNTMGTAVAGLLFTAAVLLALYHLQRRWWLPLLAGLAGLAGIVVFTVGMSTAADVITGSLWGSGDVSIALSGYDAGSVAASWSPALGFYLALAGVILLLAGLRAQLRRALHWLWRRIPTF
ncbi:MAG: MSCRAMM family protein, partial [Thermoplasmatota archaeon]